MHNPYEVVKMFESNVAEYTGAKYAVSTDSCTNALFLCLKWWQEQIEGFPTKPSYTWKVTIPKRTYLSVPQTIINAGYEVVFEDKKWKGIYNLGGTPIYDAAKRFHKNMYSISNSLMCLSFHIKKHIPIGKGGMILTDNKECAEWLKKARYEGRSEAFYTEDQIDSAGWNMYMEPTEAARGLMLLQEYSKTAYHEDLPENYRDLTEFNLFKNCKVIGE